jgi:hypothetical protein
MLSLSRVSPQFDSHCFAKKESFVRDIFNRRPAWLRARGRQFYRLSPRGEPEQLVMDCAQLLAYLLIVFVYLLIVLVQQLDFVFYTRNLVRDLDSTPNNGEEQSPNFIGTPAGSRVRSSWRHRCWNPGGVDDGQKRRLARSTPAARGIPRVIPTKAAMLPG